MKVIFLGTNGWYDSDTGNGICTLVDTGSEYFVLDAGNGIYKLDRYIKDERPVYLFISHLHLDHIVGLHMLNKFSFKQGMNIILGDGLKDGLLKVIAPPYSSPLCARNLKVSITEASAFNKLPVNIRVFPMQHSVPCFGLRIESGGKIISYAADTGLCPGAESLAERADLLMAECSYRPGERNPGWPHLNPEDAASLARDSGAKKLALTHFEAFRYNTFEKRDEAQSAARKIFPDAVAVRDGMEIKLG